MPVTFTVNERPAQTVQFIPKPTPQSFAGDIRRKVDTRLSPHHAEASTHLLSSSLRPLALTQIIPSKNGFVDACITAYNHHHHLVIRPDDIWMSIIAQFSFYVNAHAEDLSEQIAPRARRKKFTVAADSNTWCTDFRWITESYIGIMKRNLRDKDLAQWILPGFSTTTKADALCTSIMMMGVLESYTSYESMPLCGIPNVTLEGRKSDYVEILRRLDKLPEFGEETRLWAMMLRPIITRFIQAFDGEPDTMFWNCICHQTAEMCGDEHYTGWITAFCPFDQHGRWQLFSPWVPKEIGHLCLDGITYQALKVDQIPWGFCQADVKIIRDGKRVDAAFVAGLMGVKVSDASSSDSDSALGLIREGVDTTVSAYPAWFLYEKNVVVPTSHILTEESLELHQFLRSGGDAFISSGVPVMRIPSPIEFSALPLFSERPPQLTTKNLETRYQENSSSGSSSGNMTDREGSRKLRKPRPPTNNSSSVSSGESSIFPLLRPNPIRKPLAPISV